MPYECNAELPEQVRAHLPAHAQDIYREAFNHAWDEYEGKSSRRTEESREEVSHKVAWAAVKHAGYARGHDGDWHHRT